MADKIGTIVDSSVATLIGIILLCSMVIPIGVDQIGQLTGVAAQYGSILRVVLLMSIVAVIYGVIRFFSNSKE